MKTKISVCRKTSNGLDIFQRLRWRFRMGGVLCVVGLCWGVSGLARAQVHSNWGGQRDLTLMTRNVYVGADLGPIVSLDPTDPLYAQKLVQEVTATYVTIVAITDFQRRAPALATEIAARSPDLVGLQEVSLLRRQSPGDLIWGGVEPASEIVVDYLDLLLENLNELGAHYEAVVVVTNWDVEMPAYNLETGGLDDVRLTDHDVILARADLPPGQLRLANPQSGHFVNKLILPSIGLLFERGWCSVDAFVRGRKFRFINTHLEEETFPALQWLQAQELLAGPCFVDMPVVLAGDLNTDGNGQNGTLTYQGLLQAGWTDPWKLLHPGDPGLTWGHDSLLVDPTVAFVWRIDHVLTLGGKLVPAEMSIVDSLLPGAEPPWWPSDHAGVFARFWLP